MRNLPDDTKRATVKGDAWYQKLLTQPIPRKRDLFIARIETLGPKITRITGSVELRIGNRDCGVA